MINKFQKIHHAGIDCFIREIASSDRRILITAGLHGDEGSIIPLLEDFLFEFEGISDSIVFIPRMSPSALRSGRRLNDSGHDSNRLFGRKQDDPEHNGVVETIDQHAPYDLVVSFHEDVDYPETYVYDTGRQLPLSKVIDWRYEVQQLGIPLLNGLDDPNDPELQHVFVDGYNHISHPGRDGQLETWIVLSGLTPQSLTIEIPSSLTSEQKTELIWITFQKLIF